MLRSVENVRVCDGSGCATALERRTLGPRSIMNGQTVCYCCCFGDVRGAIRAPEFSKAVFLAIAPCKVVEVLR